MSDPEGDVRMQSSSEGSEDDLDPMFPNENQPSNTANLTPQNSNLYENMQQFSELSPPTSQDPADPRSFRNDPMETNTGQASSYDLLQTGESGSVSTNDLSVADRAPGASWNNSKHKGEEDRAKEQLLDKNFSLREFGDLYNEKDMSDEI
ncbi:MAG: hypothetical protein L6R42_011546 [Xanthoria sp. 1 TBL-2021]|nr:MAG: hypothetical protein L6R42_011546 [Xanthoria sp. 1 TBL-2021]